MNSAKTNQKLTNDVLEVMREHCMRDIEEAVTIAVATGKFETSVKLSPLIRDSIAFRLEGLGYKVKFAFGGIATICWEAQP